MSSDWDRTTRPGFRKPSTTGSPSSESRCRRRSGVPVHLTLVASGYGLHNSEPLRLLTGPGDGSGSPKIGPGTVGHPFASRADVPPSDGAA